MLDQVAEIMKKVDWCLVDRKLLDTFNATDASSQLQSITNENEEYTIKKV